VISLQRKHRFLLSILSGILLVVSFPYTGSMTPLVFIALVPLLLVESYITMKNYRSRKVFTHAFLTFLIYNVGVTWWVAFADLNGALLAFIANTLLMTVVFYMFHLTKKFVGSKEGYLSLLIYWIGFEYLHYHWEASWTWLTLGNTFSIVPSWVQWYSYSGALGGSFWILCINLLIYRIYQNTWFKGESWRIQTPLLIMAGAFFVIPMTISLITYATYTENENPYEVVAIQPNVDPYNEKFTSNPMAQLQDMGELMLSKATKNTDLILAPETAISSSFDESSFKRMGYYAYLRGLQEELGGTSICIGASTVKFFDKPYSRASRIHNGGPGWIEYYNTSIFLDEVNDPQFIHKSKLVPGVESIPFSDIFPFLEDLAIQNGGTSGTLGTEPFPKVFYDKDVRFAPVVCYESIYGGWVAEQCRNGAQLICILTNDGWWEDTPGYKQHCSFASLRAIENRRSIARSANTGTSCFVNQRGDILQPTKWWTKDVIKAKLNLNSEQSFFTTYGNVMGRSFAFVAALLILFTFVKRFKKYRSSL
jgi:apolipoprotein N-acyltransferase